MHYISSNVKKLMEVKNLSISELSRQTGVSKATISRWFNEEKIPRLDMIEKIAFAFDLPIDYFMDDSFTEYWKETDNGWEWKDDSINERTYQASAGRGRINSEYGETESHYKDDGDYVRVKIVGDSMLPELRDGDVVRVRLTKETDPKKLSIVKINGDETCCKRVETTDTGVWIRSDNEDYEDVFYSVQEVMTLPVTIVGVVEELVSRKY